MERDRPGRVVDRAPGPAGEERHRAQAVVSLAIGEVARYLGNTPAVCRSSYVDPRVVDRFNAGQTILGTLERLPVDLPEAERQREIEEAVLELLRA